MVRPEERLCRSELVAWRDPLLLRNCLSQMGDFLSFSCGCEGGYPGAVWEDLMTDTILNLFGQVSRLWLAEGMCRNPVQDVGYHCGLPLCPPLGGRWHSFLGFC